MGQRTWSGCGGIGQRDAHCRASAAASLKNGTGAAPTGSSPGRNPIFAPNNTLSNVAASRIACRAARSCQYRSPVSPLYTPEEFLNSRAGRLPAINSPQAISLTVRHSGRGHRDLLPGNYGVADEWNRRRNFSMISRARPRAPARKGVSILGVVPGSFVSRQ